MNSVYEYFREIHLLYLTETLCMCKQLISIQRIDQRRRKMTLSGPLPVLVTTAMAPTPPPDLAWITCVPLKRACLRWVSELYVASLAGSGVFITGTLSPEHKNEQRSVLAPWKLWKDSFPAPF